MKLIAFLSIYILLKEYSKIERIKIVSISALYERNF